MRTINTLLVILGTIIMFCVVLAYEIFRLLVTYATIMILFIAQPVWLISWMFSGKYLCMSVIEGVIGYSKRIQVDILP